MLKTAVVLLVFASGILSLLTVQTVSACGRCWNVTIGETIDGIMVDRTGSDAGYAIEMSCTTLNKPDPPGSTLNLACEENYKQSNIRYTN